MVEINIRCIQRIHAKFVMSLGWSRLQFRFKGLWRF